MEQGHPRDPRIGVFKVLVTVARGSIRGEWRLMSIPPGVFWVNDNGDCVPVSAVNIACRGEEVDL